MIWRDNEGMVPWEAEGRRVMVQLRGGIKPPESWPADSGSSRSPPVNWALTGSAFDIVRYAVV